MEHGLNLFIKQLVETYFPYSGLQGNYTPEERARYEKLARRLRPVFWIVAFLFIMIVWISTVIGVNDLIIYLWNNTVPGSICYRSFSGFSFLYSAIISAGVAFPMASVMLLKLFYPFQYRQIIDFISVADKIDNYKMAQTLFKIFFIAFLPFFGYDIFNCTLVQNDSVYIKEFDTLPTTIPYRDITSITHIRYVSSRNVNDTIQHYTIVLRGGKTIPLFERYDVAQCAENIATRARVAIMHM